MKPHSTTIDPEEISRFSEVSENWWDEHGPFAPIHRINPVRMAYIKEVLCHHFDRDLRSLSALKGLKIIDIGCGGGLACEPLARLGANVTGIDADGNAIAAAQIHAEKTALNHSISYRCTTSDQMLPKAKNSFDVVLALEIVEHVSDVGAFVQSCADLCKPGGVVIFSTLNRTLKSMALAKIAAEYILRWVPAGTHDWRKFLRPSDLTNALQRAEVNPVEVKGLVFNPLKNAFSMSDTDLDVNYFIISTKD